MLVRRLNAEETLGAIDLIVTDKTGTLTRNRLDVRSVSTLAGPVEEPARLAYLLEALRAEDDAWVRGEGTAPGSFTASLERAVEAAGGDPSLDPAELIETEPVSDGSADLTDRPADAGGPRGARHRCARGDLRPGTRPTSGKSPPGTL